MSLNRTSNFIQKHIANMDKDLDIQIVETLKAYLASGVENQVDYQKF